MNIIILLFICNSLTTASAMQQEFYRAMVFPITSTAYQTIQKAETKLVCASKCLYMSTNCSVFFFDLKKKSCIVTRLEQLSSANNSLETILGYVSNGNLSFLKFKMFKFFINLIFNVAQWATFISITFFNCNCQHCLHPSCKWYRGLNLQPFGHELSAFNTWPWLLAF